jgi:hypothetical protein
MGDVEQNGHSNPRMDRLEKLMDLRINDHLSFTDEHKRLLTAQVVLTETVQQLAEAQKRTEAQLKENAEAQTVLMRMMDDWIRNRPNP